MRFAGEVVKNQKRQRTDKYFSHKFLKEGDVLKKTTPQLWWRKKTKETRAKGSVDMPQG